MRRPLRLAFHCLPDQSSRLLVFGVAHFVDHLLQDHRAHRQHTAWPLDRIDFADRIVRFPPERRANGSYIEKLGHAATWTCSFWAYMAYLVSGCRCSQEQGAASRPMSDRSCTAMWLPSPSPNTFRSTWVGRSLRRLAMISPSGPIGHCEMWGYRRRARGRRRRGAQSCSVRTIHLGVAQ